jgi:hypothetical protein
MSESDNIVVSDWRYPNELSLVSKSMRLCGFQVIPIRVDVCGEPQSIDASERYANSPDI